MDSETVFPSVPLNNYLDVTHLQSLFHYKYPKNYKFTGETHNYWELIYASQGTLTITAGSNEFLLKSGQIAFHQPLEFHAVSTYGDNPASAIICGFTCRHPVMDFFREYVTTLQNEEFGYLHKMLYFRAHIFFNCSVPFSSYPKPSNQTPFVYSQTIKSNLELLLLSLLIRNKYKPQNKQTEITLQIDNYHKLTQSVISYMEQNICNKLTLEQISSAVGYSVSRMSKLFYLDMKHGIMEYFTKMKIDEAKFLISKNEQNISQIAESLGFCNATHFTHMFKRYEGIKPTDFKRKCLTGQLLKKGG